MSFHAVSEAVMCWIFMPGVSSLGIIMLATLPINTYSVNTIDL